MIFNFKLLQLALKKGNLPFCLLNRICFLFKLVLLFNIFFNFLLQLVNFLWLKLHILLLFLNLIPKNIIFILNLFNFLTILSKNLFKLFKFCIKSMIFLRYLLILITFRLQAVLKDLILTLECIILQLRRQFLNPKGHFLNLLNIRSTFWSQNVIFVFQFLSFILIILLCSFNLLNFSSLIFKLIAFFIIMSYLISQFLFLSI